MLQIVQPQDPQNLPTTLIVTISCNVGSYRRNLITDQLHVGAGFPFQSSLKLFTTPIPENHSTADACSCNVNIQSHTQSIFDQALLAVCPN